MAKLCYALLFCYGDWGIFTREKGLAAEGRVMGRFSFSGLADRAGGLLVMRGELQIGILCSFLLPFSISAATRIRWGISISGFLISGSLKEVCIDYSVYVYRQRD